MKPLSSNKPITSRVKNARTAFGLLLTLTLPLLFLACPGKDSRPTSNTGNTVAPPAASPTSTAASPRLAIDGARAFEHVRKQVEFGPRPAGSAELARTREYIVGELKSYGGLNVTVDEWQAKTPIGARNMANVTAEL